MFRNTHRVLALLVFCLFSVSSSLFATNTDPNEDSLIVYLILFVMLFTPVCHWLESMIEAVPFQNPLDSDIQINKITGPKMA